jgi:hypothetical protein
LPEEKIIGRDLRNYRYGIEGLNFRGLDNYHIEDGDLSIGRKAGDRRMYMKFWLLWGFDALIASVLLYFFFTGLSDGPVSSFNMGLWLIILLGLTGIMGGSLCLLSAGRRGVAMAVLLPLAIPGFFYALFLLILIITASRWN